MKTDAELEAIRQEAIGNLDKAAAELKRKLRDGELNHRVWEDTPFGVRTKVGRGYLVLWTPAKELRPHQYPGVQYTSSMGANSDNSYSGFLPGVTYEQAKLLVFGDYLRYTK